MFFAALLLVTLLPALAVILIKGRLHSEDSLLNRGVKAVYALVVGIAVRLLWPVVIAALFSLLATAPVFNSLGNEFRPPLNEGSILYWCCSFFRRYSPSGGDVNYRLSCIRTRATKQPGCIATKPVC